MSVESEGWATFAMIGSMVLINPYIMALTQVPEISERVSVDALVWTTPAVAILASLVVLSRAVIGLTGWFHARKPAFYCRHARRRRPAGKIALHGSPAGAGHAGRRVQIGRAHV